MRTIKRATDKWMRFWMRMAGMHTLGRISAGIAAWGQPPYYSRIPLSRYRSKSYISIWATLHHRDLKIGRNVFIDQNVLIYQDSNGSSIDIGNEVHLHRNTILQTGNGGSIIIGTSTHIQPRCQFSAYVSPIIVGSRSEIGPACAFYSYNHKVDESKPVRDLPLESKGGIILEDDVWLGYGVIVLDGVRIGSGAVIGAGSVVTRSIPPNAIAAGNPARVVKTRTLQVDQESVKKSTWK